MWQPTRREALAAGRDALSKRREGERETPGRAEDIEIEERVSC
jgi:hypothetical protein